MLVGSETIQSLNASWVSTWAEIKTRVKHPPRDLKDYIEWCRGIKDLVSGATDIHLSLRKHGLGDKYPIDIDDELGGVLQTWEKHALAWGYNPGSWSSVAEAATEQNILMQGLGNLFGTNLADLNIIHSELSPGCSPSVGDADHSESTNVELLPIRGAPAQISPSASATIFQLPTPLPNPTSNGRPNDKDYAQMWQRLKDARATLDELRLKKSQLQSEREGLLQVITSGLAEIELMAGIT